jgi:hypothetical protein
MDGLLRDAFQRESIMYIQERVRITVDALIAIANSATALPGREYLLWIRQLSFQRRLRRFVEPRPDHE